MLEENNVFNSLKHF